MRRGLTWAAAVACTFAVGICGELSLGALLTVAAVGLTVLAVGLARRAGAAATAVGRSGLPWLGWLAAAAAWEVVTLADVGRPTLSDLADPLLASPAVRGVATLGWLAAGAWLIARPRGPVR
ncbi:hypothetical protein [Geodermatophilus sp. TF02-6]|uniref:hypothetical protein n=1 Tax=Geodermatophilus sp. TF02-6 TaxID=2250575 RepID=UPI001F2B98D8|nr:hypothetical protein [Geodermatophilus sp. TF02-6]